MTSMAQAYPKRSIGWAETVWRALRARWVISITGIVVLIAIWSVLTETGYIGSDTLPSPTELIAGFGAFFRDGYAGASAWNHIGVSLRRTLIGFGLAAIVGLPLGTIMGASSVLDALVSPIFSFIRPIPMIGLVPLLVLYFGIGESSKIAVIFVAGLVYIVLGAREGVRSVPQDLIRASEILGSSRTATLFYVVIPGAMPGIMTGLRTGAAISWTLVVAAELLAASSGLGFMVKNAAELFQLTDVYVGLILIGIIGMMMDILLQLLSRRLLHWQGL